MADSRRYGLNAQLGNFFYWDTFNCAIDFTGVHFLSSVRALVNRNQRSIPFEAFW